jgi:hypothetical protein
LKNYLDKRCLWKLIYIDPNYFFDLEYQNHSEDELGIPREELCVDSLERYLDNLDFLPDEDYDKVVCSIEERHDDITKESIIQKRYYWDGQKSWLNERVRIDKEGKRNMEICLCILRNDEDDVEFFRFSQDEDGILRPIQHSFIGPYD